MKTIAYIYEKLTKEQKDILLSCCHDSNEEKLKGVTSGSLPFVCLEQTIDCLEGMLLFSL